MTELAYFKLTNAEDIVGQIEKTNWLTYTLISPLKVFALRVDGVNEVYFDLAPWTFFADTRKIELPKWFVLGKFKVYPYLQEQYWNSLTQIRASENFMNQPQEIRMQAIREMLQQGNSNPKIH